jgi:four helix bundle protein
MSEQPPPIPARSFEFAVRVVNMCQELEALRGSSRILVNQLLRSGTSIGANVEEAQGAQSKADFTAKMYIACKEARETHYWLRVFIETNLAPKNRLAPLLDEANQLVAILTTITKNSRPTK